MQILKTHTHKSKEKQLMLSSKGQQRISAQETT